VAYASNELVDGPGARPERETDGRPWDAVLRRFEQGLLAALGADECDRRSHRSPAADWDELRRALGLARLELRGPGGAHLTAPAARSRRVDEAWLAGLAEGVAAVRPAGAGPLVGLDTTTVAYRSGALLLVVQGAPEVLGLPPWPSGSSAAAPLRVEGRLGELLHALRRIGGAVLAATRAAEERRHVGQLARIGARAGGRLHDLRNQLTLALFRADEVVQRGPAPGEDERRERSRTALVDELRRAREIAADGIVLQRAGHDLPARDGDDARVLRRVPLRALLVEEARALAATARAAGARVRARCPADLEVLGDSMILGRLVRNLLLNAAESRVGGASLSVDVTRAEGSRATLVFEDDGTGMDADTLAGYLDAGRTVGGSGFGTASVREALERLDGMIQVASAPGRGTRVRLDLWAAPPNGGALVLAVGPSGGGAVGHGTCVQVTSPLRALALLEGLAPARIELHRSALGPGRRQLLRAAARLGIPVVARSARETFALSL
jgi:signal transduction histidine kinase